MSCNGYIQYDADKVIEVELEKNESSFEKIYKVKTFREAEPGSGKSIS